MVGNENKTVILLTHIQGCTIVAGSVSALKVVQKDIA